MAYFKARVGGSGGNEPVLLWENPNPNSAFKDTSWLPIDYSGYNYLMFRVKSNISTSISPNITKDYIIEFKGEPDSFVIGTPYSGDDNSNSSFRVVKIGYPGYTNLGINFSIGYSTYQWQTSGGQCVPLAIYGLKNSPINI